ncbi:uncharacterized protein LOC135332017 [Halichondria panicea]|uniref:uncharacterized protein LOC135332017 n=1 Tax=Halichondria panicea TaxID=6063 RepID=UPI00312BAB23
MDSNSGSDTNKSIRRQKATTNVSTGSGDLAAVERTDLLAVVPSKPDSSVISITRCDSGYTGSTRTSTVFEDPQNVDMISEAFQFHGTVVESVGQSAGSSQYVTALTSLHISEASSIDDGSPSPRPSLPVSPSLRPSLPVSSIDDGSLSPRPSLPVSPVDDIVPVAHSASQSIQQHKDVESKEERSEVDGPFPGRSKRAPKLSKMDKSQSVECATTQCRPRLRRGSQTVPVFDSSMLQEAITKVQACRQELNEDHEQTLKQTVMDNAVAFRDSIDFNVLLAHLFKHNLVHSLECEFFISKEHSRLDKANTFLFEILNRKGPSAYRSFYYSLNQEKQHRGHQHLVELMNSALHQLAE